MFQKRDGLRLKILYFFPDRLKTVAENQLLSDSEIANWILNVCIRVYYDCILIPSLTFKNKCRSRTDVQIRSTINLHLCIPDLSLLHSLSEGTFYNMSDWTSDWTDMSVIEVYMSIYGIIHMNWAKTSGNGWRERERGRYNGCINCWNPVCHHTM